MTRDDEDILHPLEAELQLERVLHALADPLRLAIVRRIAAQASGSASCSALLFDRPKSSVSHHFRVLREAGVLWTSAEGTTHMNSLRREELDRRFPGLMAAILRETVLEDA